MAAISLLDCEVDDSVEVVEFEEEAAGVVQPKSAEHASIAARVRGSKDFLNMVTPLSRVMRWNTKAPSTNDAILHEKQAAAQMLGGL